MIRVVSEKKNRAGKVKDSLSLSLSQTPWFGMIVIKEPQAEILTAKWKTLES